MVLINNHDLYYKIMTFFDSSIIYVLLVIKYSWNMKSSVSTICFSSLVSNEFILSIAENIKENVTEI